jgi:hypothetical protein
VNSVDVTRVAPYEMKKCSPPPLDGEGSGVAKPIVAVESLSPCLHVQIVPGAA